MAECPREALASSLPSGAKVVLAALWLRAGSGRRFVWPSRETLAADVGGMSERQLRRCLADLEAGRWIVPEKDRHGHAGWSLCDPPGHVVHAHESEPNATHDRCPDIHGRPADIHGRPADIHVRTAVKNVRTSMADRTSMSAKPDIHGQRISMEPTMNQIDGGNSRPLSPTVQERADSAAGLPPPPHKIGATAWRSDFVFAWSAAQAGARVTVSDPTRGAHRLVELQAMLDEHGPETVTAVLLHAQAEVIRHHETDERFGLHPRMLAVTFRADKPQAFEALLDAWQRDTKKKRVTGKLGAPPAKLDGVPLDDDDSRAWMTSLGHDPEQAVRDARMARQAEGDAVEMLEALAGSFAGVTS
jgi:hypothetical protein